MSLIGAIMDRVVEISLLLDFYGQMLTKRQAEILDLHYNSDYSLGEIAELLNISRQGAYDNIKRGKNTLEEMEKKLGLVAKFMEQKQKTQEILKTLQSIDTACLSGTDRQKLQTVCHEIEGMLLKL